MVKIPGVKPYWLLLCILLVMVSTVSGCNLIPQLSPLSSPSMAGSSPTPQLFIIIPSPTMSLTPIKMPDTPLSPSITPASISTTTPTSTAKPPSPTPALQVVTGDLKSMLAQFELETPRQGSQRFAQPDDTAIDGFTLLVSELFSENFLSANEIASKYGYELVYYTDSNKLDEGIFILREKSPIQRAWGMYFFRLETCRTTSPVAVLQAPHILADEGTAQIAMDAFLGLRGCALMVAGAHRYANFDGSADIAHNPRTVYMSVQNSLANFMGPATMILQIHGFSAEKHPGYPSVILGGNPSGNLDGEVFLGKLTRSLVEQGISIGICNGINWTDLCGETNVLANNLAAGFFIHLEMDESSRTNPIPLMNSLGELLR